MKTQKQLIDLFIKYYQGKNGDFDVCNFFIEKNLVEQNLEYILNAIYACSEGEDYIWYDEEERYAQYWSADVVKPILDMYPNNKKVLSVIYKSLIRAAKQYGGEMSDGCWLDSVAQPFIYESDATQKQKETIKKLYHLSE